MSTLATPPAFPSRDRIAGPWLSVSFALLAVACFPVSGAIEANRVAIASGELWRVFTGHLAHYSLSHLGWDVLTFFVLASFVEQRGRAMLKSILTLSALAIPAAVALVHPDMPAYRGLSGIDSALFTASMALLLASARRDRDTFRAVASLAGLMLFAAKLLYEVIAGQTLFVNAESSGFVPVPSAHLAGGLCGVIAVMLHRIRPKERGRHA